MGTGEDDTPDNMNDLSDPVVLEQQLDGSKGHKGQYNPENLNGSKESNYLPLSEEEVSLGAEDFIVPKDPLDQEKFKRQPTSTTRSLKKIQ